MARRLTKSAINWAKFAELVPKEEMSNFAALRAKSDNYSRIVYELPESLPAIDFSYYKTRIANPKLAEEFEQKYKAVKIPYPEDKYSAKIDSMAEESKKEIAEFIRESKMRIEQLNAERAKLKEMVPLEHMTMEEFAEAFPDQAWNKDKPTFYPHDPEIEKQIWEALAEERAGKKDAH